MDGVLIGSLVFGWAMALISSEVYIGSHNFKIQWGVSLFILAILQVWKIMINRRNYNNSNNKY